jgi:hypothetical protein
MKDPTHRLQLSRDHDQVLVTLEDRDEACPVKIVWARPVSGRGREVSILDAKSNEELIMLESLDRLDKASRLVAEEALDLRYLVPCITAINRADVSYGNRYFDVETDRGPRQFLIKDPNANVIHVTDDRLMIRDVIGNRYEIVSVAALDLPSRHALDQVI